MGILEFLGGAAFRMIWGELSAYFTRKQEHKQEMERLEAQSRYENEAHQRRLGIITAETSAKVEVIRVQDQADVNKLEASAFEKAVEAVGRMTGITWVDGWNAMIRPGVATWSILMMTLAEFKVVTLSEMTQSITAAALGLYLADRTLAKRNK